MKLQIQEGKALFCKMKAPLGLYRFSIIQQWYNVVTVMRIISSATRVSRSVSLPHRWDKDRMGRLGTVGWSSDTQNRISPDTADRSWFCTGERCVPPADRRSDRLGCRDSLEPPSLPWRQCLNSSSIFAMGLGSRHFHSDLTVEPDLSTLSNTASRIYKPFLC